MATIARTPVSGSAIIARTRRPSGPASSARTSANRRTLGIEGEAQAADYLERQGFQILERNARAERVEIDLIARRGGLLIFVEVKTRSSARAGTGDEAVDARKRARLVRGAEAWLRAHGNMGVRRVRFDVIACTLGEDGWHFRHWPGAFDASD